MEKLIIDQTKVGDIKKLIALCPFHALEERDGKLEINAACKMCRLCVKQGPAGAVTVQETEDRRPALDKDQWRGIAVYVDHVDGEIHPVTYELIGKARELASKIGHPVYALFAGSGLSEQCRELLHYGVDAVYVYDQNALEHFTIEAYTNVLEDFIENVKPSSILVGATTVGRQLAPRTAARVKTGLTADCTILDMSPDTDLIQIRPAFGGNIMAQIHTPDHRPQMATVRYKIMTAPTRSEEESGEIIPCLLPEKKLHSNLDVLEVLPKAPETSIEACDVLVVAGRGVKKEGDLDLLRELAALLGGQLACTRPMIEAGWMDAKRQIGLSGRTVRPKLIITCGVSGSVQFAAGMNNADHIVAINTDEKAAIFRIAHCCLVGDLYEIVPGLIAKIKANRGLYHDGI
ncbi:electron transfer flavoprotein subunit alpha [Bacilliculturomica massiliensis]|uniref:electron transfer flavoprotein subunit alpha n=1 Tax=Bacilliculturomica massiliensis TaxID=1917867 RepID=UPI00102FD83E|nr:electron transfer flavoprotein subunit alpha/FixB family protein [Bacilliculturomica massiliensis]